MPRVFIYDGREFDDFDPTMSVDAVRQSMTNFFPELANADVTTSSRKNKQDPAVQDTVYEFKRRVGTKG